MAYTFKPSLLAPYMKLDQGDKIQAECMFPRSVSQPRICTTVRFPVTVLTSLLAFFTDVWIDGDGGLRCKTMVRFVSRFFSYATRYVSGCITWTAHSPDNGVPPVLPLQPIPSTHNPFSLRFSVVLSRNTSRRP